MPAARSVRLDRRLSVGYSARYISANSPRIDIGLLGSQGGGPSPSGVPHFVLTQWNKNVRGFVNGKYAIHIPMDTTSPLPETLDRKGQENASKARASPISANYSRSEVPKGFNGRQRRALLRSRPTIRRTKFRAL